jgi:hypothetical protein
MLETSEFFQLVPPRPTLGVVAGSLPCSFYRLQRQKYFIAFNKTNIQLTNNSSPFQTGKDFDIACWFAKAEQNHPASPIRKHIPNRESNDAKGQHLDDGETGETGSIEQCRENIASRTFIDDWL